MNDKIMTSDEFDKYFDEGGSVMPFAKMETLHRPGRGELPPRRVNLDMPEWVVNELDRTASTIGVTRQSLIKMWLVDRLRESGVRLPVPPASSTTTTITHV